MRVWMGMVVIAAAIGCDIQQGVNVKGAAWVGLAIAALDPTSPRPDAPKKCCGLCNGTGKVRTGDGLALVPCDCPDDCKCKAKPTKATSPTVRPAAQAESCNGFCPSPIARAYP